MTQVLYIYTIQNKFVGFDLNWANLKVSTIIAHTIYMQVRLAKGDKFAIKF